jgi:excisionase family DNA binding protein
MKTDSNTILKLYKIDEVARLFGISKTTMYRLVDSRKIPFFKIKGNIRFSEDDLLSYLDVNRIESVQ